MKLVKIFNLFLNLALLGSALSHPILAATDGLGSITNPLPYSGTGPGGGLIILLNNVLRLVFVGAGIYAFIRLIVAGLGFISAGGDSKKMTSAWNSIWQSLLGLIIIIGSFAIAALIGQLLYRDPGAILSPKIYGPGQTPKGLP